MTLVADTLPDDPGTLKAMLIAERLRAERLEQIIKELQRHRFGRRAETLPEDQLLLGLEEVEQGVAADEAAEEKAAPTAKAERITRRRANRGSLPAHLPRIETVVDIEEKACPCRRHALHVFAEDVAERLDIVPAPFPGARHLPSPLWQPGLPRRRRPGAGAGAADRGWHAYRSDRRPRPRSQICRPSAALPPGANLRPPGRPSRPLDARRLGRAGCIPVATRPRTTVGPPQDIIEAVCRRDHGAGARSRPRPDQDRPALRLRPERSALAGRRPACRRLHLSPDRKAERPIAHLKGFVGILQVDGYGGYKVLAEKVDVRFAFCWAHVRQRFYELAAAGPAPIATELLERIAALYRNETDIRGRPAEVRRLARQERTKLVLDALEPFLREKLQLISQKTKLAEPIRYTLSRWEGLCRFIDEGCLEIHNNTVERSIRPLALTRKNALFAGSDGGAGHWAVIASLIETCKLNGVDLWAISPTSSR